MTLKFKRIQMITIQNYKKEVLGSGGDDGSVVQGAVNTRLTCLVYINYNKGSEDNLTLTFDSYFRFLDEYYPIMYEDSATTVTRVKKIFNKSGKYRVLITLGDNENNIRVNAIFNNAGDNPGTAIITPVPMIATI